MTYHPQKGDVVAYNGWTCRIPYFVDADDTVTDLVRMIDGADVSYAPNVHISCLKLISRAPEPVPTFCGVRGAEDDETHERAVCGAREA